MIAEYKLPGLDDWRKIVSDIVPVKDFRVQRRMRIGGYGILPTVAEQSDYMNLASPPDEEATYAISKRGGIEDWTLEMIANDDVGALRRLPQKLGRAAAMTIYQDVFSLWADTNNWYLAANGANVPLIEVGFWQGREEPELFVQEAQNLGNVWAADRISYKIRFIYGLAVLDYRGFYAGIVP